MTLILIFSKFDKQFLVKCNINCYKIVKYTQKTVVKYTKKNMLLKNLYFYHTFVEPYGGAYLAYCTINHKKYANA